MSLPTRSLALLASVLVLAAACGQISEEDVIAEFNSVPAPTVGARSPTTNIPTTRFPTTTSPSSTSLPETTETTRRAPSTTRGIGVFRLDAPESVEVGAVFEVVATVEQGGKVTAVELESGGCSPTDEGGWTADSTSICRFSGVQESTSRYRAGQASAEVQTVGLPAGLTMDGPESVTAGEAFDVEVRTDSGAEVEISVAGQCRTTPTRGQLLTTAGGTCFVNATQGATSTHRADKASKAVVVRKLSGQIAVEGPTGDLGLPENFSVKAWPTAGGPATIGAGTGACTATEQQTKHPDSNPDAVIRQFRTTDTGTCTISVTQADNPTHIGANRVVTYKVVQAPAGLNLIVPATANIGEVLTVEVETDSEGKIVLSASGRCTLTGNRIEAVAAEECVINATQAGTPSHQPATASKTVTINKLRGEIAIDGPATDLFHPQTFAIEAWPTAGGPLTIGSGSGACTAPGPQDNNPSPYTDSVIRGFTTTGTGTCSITIEQADTATHIGATRTVSFSVSLPTGVVRIDAPAALEYDNSDYMPYNDFVIVVAVQAGSRDVRITLEGECVEVEQVREVLPFGPRMQATVTGPGTCVIEVSQADSDTHVGATATHTITITKPKGSFFFYGLDQVSEGSTIWSSVEYVQGGDVTVEVVAGPCTKLDDRNFQAPQVDADTVCTLRATQAEDADYSPADPESIDVIVQDTPPPSTTTTAAPTTTTTSPQSTTKPTIEIP